MELTTRGESSDYLKRIVEELDFRSIGLPGIIIDPIPKSIEEATRILEMRKMLQQLRYSVLDKQSHEI